MVTKYSTGDLVLIPASIRTAEEVNGEVIYHVEADIWEGIPENAIVLNENVESQKAMQSFLDSLKERNRAIR